MKIERDRIVEFIGDIERSQTNFQIDNFVIGQSGDTVYGRYKQAVRELSGRYEGLKELYLDREEKKLELKRLEHVLSTVSDEDRVLEDIERKKIKLKIIRQNSVLDNLERAISDGEKEFARFYQHCESLKAKLGPLDEKKKMLLESEHWTNKLKAAAVVDLMTHGSIQSGTIDAIVALPSDDRMRLLACFNKENQPATFNWFYTRGKDCDLDTLKLGAGVDNGNEIEDMIKKNYLEK